MSNNFEKGESVISLSDPTQLYEQPRRKGSRYFVQEVMFCAGCGAQWINLGYKVELNGGPLNCECAPCKNVQSARGLYWTHRVHFARPSELSILEAEAVNREDYEAAADLRDIIKSL